jgi:pilus assembly protein CpaE
LVAHIKALLSRSKTRGGPPVQAAPLERGYMIGVVSARGGLGVSSLVLNLALAYNQKHKANIIAAETRPGQGTWALELGLAIPEGMNNLLKMKPADITVALVEKELFRTTFGIRMLLASPRMQDCELMNNTAQLEAILQHVATLGSLILVDIGTPFQPGFEKVVGLCQEIIVVTEPQPYTIQRTRMLINEMGNLGVGRSKLLNLVLINRLRADVQLSIVQVQEMLGGQPVSLLIPPAPEQAFHAAMKYVPFTMLQPDGLVAQQYLRLAEQISQRIKK